VLSVALLSCGLAAAQTSAVFRNVDAYRDNGVRQAAIFHFPRKFPGGSLTATVPATVTFTAAMGGCPLGVKGSDAAHYLYVSEGTGTPESVLLTGGTCAGDGLAGTITFTPANSHSGAWSVQSATLGIQEACSDLPSTGGTVDASGLTGSLTLLKTVTISKTCSIVLPVPAAATITTSANPAFSVSTASNVSISGGKLVLSGSAASAVQYVGTVSNLTIEGMTVAGSGSAGDAQQGFWNNSGQTLSNMRILNNTISGVILGISVNADLSGSINGFLIEGNHLSNIVGTSSGQGYGIHHANGSGNPSNGRIVDNFIEKAQRHSIYQARGSGVVISGNSIYNHRDTVSDGSQRGALIVARSKDVAVDSNMVVDSYDGGIEVESGAGSECSNIVISNNVIRNTHNFSAMTIGTDNPAVDGTCSDSVVSGNTIYHDNAVDATFAGALVRIYTGHRLSFVGNQSSLIGAASTQALFYIIGTGETSGTATYTNNLKFTGNVIYGTNGAGATYGFEFGTAASISGIRAEFESNRVDVGNDAFLFDAAQTNANLRAFGTPTTGLNTLLAAQINGTSSPILSTLFSIDRGATGDPRLKFLLAGNERAYLQYSDSTSMARLDSDGGIEFAANNATLMTLDSDTQVLIEGSKAGAEIMAVENTNGTGYGLAVVNAADANYALAVGNGTNNFQVFGTGRVETNGDILPGASGQNLGSTTKRWDAFLVNVDMEGTLTVGEALTVNTASGLGSPKVELQQATTPRAFLEYQNATGTLRLDSDGSISLAPNNVISLTLDTAGNIATPGIFKAESITVNTASGTGSPKLALQQNGTERAYLNYDNATSTARFDSDGGIILAPNNAAALTLSTGLDATFASDATITDNLTISSIAASGFLSTSTAGLVIGSTASAFRSLIDVYSTGQVYTAAAVDAAFSGIGPCSAGNFVNENRAANSPVCANPLSGGLSQGVDVKGSDGNTCTMTFTAGILTSESCP
jgi:hypothetical protein